LEWGSCSGVPCWSVPPLSLGASEPGHSHSLGPHGQAPSRWSGPAPIR
jgi:hypothetical protein